MREELKEKFESFYQNCADPWDYWKSEYELRKYYEQISLVSQFCDPKRILEVGCSIGAHTKLIHEMFPKSQITAIDISSTAIRHAKQNVSNSSLVTFHVADIFSFVDTLEMQSKDVIFWSEAFDFLHDYCTFADFSQLVHRLNFLLQPKGVMCISHILPNRLSFPFAEAGKKNVQVFHELIGDYFHQLASITKNLRKEETDASYNYGIKVYAPRLLQPPIPESLEISINQIDVVIPARDEVDTIAEVVKKVQQSPYVANVIVIDNGSVDETSSVAADAGATIIHCPERGYGRAVKHGISKCKNEWVLKLDADIENMDSLWIERLVEAAKREKLKFVKSFWTASIQDPDRVTNFTVKPAFRIFFPELIFLRSPISGIYLFNKNSINERQLPNGFSFDVAMLIYALHNNCAIGQVEIETVKHATISNGKRTYQHYFNMSDEILRYIVEAGHERLQ
jgi:SAM-dependent methyltransferase